MTDVKESPFQTHCFINVLFHNSGRQFHVFQKQLYKSQKIYIQYTISWLASCEMGFLQLGGTTRLPRTKVPKERTYHNYMGAFASVQWKSDFFID